ncbi:hypothetical protein V8C44DRAFT_322421 [Trichoderma aethiopicum]
MLVCWSISLTCLCWFSKCFRTGNSKPWVVKSRILRPGSFACMSLMALYASSNNMSLPSRPTSDEGQQWKV